jgi:hypothetical protein
MRNEFAGRQTRARATSTPWREKPSRDKYASVQAASQQSSRGRRPNCQNKVLSAAHGRVDRSHSTGRCEHFDRWVAHSSHLSLSQTNERYLGKIKQCVGSSHRRGQGRTRPWQSFATSQNISWSVHPHFFFSAWCCFSPACSSRIGRHRESSRTLQRALP